MRIEILNIDMSSFRMEVKYSQNDTLDPHLVLNWNLPLDAAGTPLTGEALWTFLHENRPVKELAALQMRKDAKFDGAGLEAMTGQVRTTTDEIAASPSPAVTLDGLSAVAGVNPFQDLLPLDTTPTLQIAGKTA